MKLTTTSALALTAAFAAASASAQGTYTPPAATVPNIPDQVQREDRPQQQQTTTTTTTQTFGQPSSAIVTHTPKVSRGAAKAIQALMTAVTSNDQAAIAAALPAAQAAATTPDDRYVIGILQLKSAAGAKNNAGIAAAIEAILASGAATQNELYPLQLNLAQTYGGLKQYDRAAAAYERALQLSPNSVDATAGLAEVRIAQGRGAEGIAMLQKGIALQSAGGGKASEAWYKRAVQLAYDAKSPAAVAISREWVRAYPSPENWRNAMAIYRNLMRPDGQTQLDLLRLARATNSLGGTGDYHIYAFETGNAANYGEAKSLIDEAIASGKIKASDPIVAEIVRTIKGKSIENESQLAAAASAANSANAMIRVGDRYFGRGDYAKAADLYRRALAQGDADKELANLRLGMALARAGDKAGATAALNAVTGPRAEVAKFWLAYVASRA